LLFEDGLYLGLLPVRMLFLRGGSVGANAASFQSGLKYIELGQRWKQKMAGAV
jgi:hypothetical protein